MSLIIKDMKMPKAGRLTLQISTEGSVYIVNHCNITTETYMTTAVSIPPHGRLIDADAMFKDICDDINAMTAVGIAVDGQWLWDKLNDALEKAPTIIPASEEN